jgi:hypothetical protein
MIFIFLVICTPERLCVNQAREWIAQGERIDHCMYNGVRNYIKFKTYLRESCGNLERRLTVVEEHIKEQSRTAASQLQNNRNFAKRPCGSITTGNTFLTTLAATGGDIAGPKNAKGFASMGKVSSSGNSNSFTTSIGTSSSSCTESDKDLDGVVNYSYDSTNSSTGSTGQLCGTGDYIKSTKYDLSCNESSFLKKNGGDFQADKEETQVDGNEGPLNVKRQKQSASSFTSCGQHELHVGTNQDDQLL